MEPIISPWLVYLIEGLDTIITLELVAMFASIAVIMILAIEKKINNRQILYLLPAPSLFLLLAILTPRTNTAYKMLIAHSVTPNRIQNVLSIMQQIMNHIH